MADNLKQNSVVKNKIMPASWIAFYNSDPHCQAGLVYTWDE